ILMPDAESVGLKKSKMLLLSIRLPVLAAPVVPRPVITFVGRLAPAAPRLQNETVLLLFPVPVVLVWNRIFPPPDPAPGTAEPRTVHRVIVLFCAPFLSRIVLVPPGFATVVFE